MQLCSVHVFKLFFAYKRASNNFSEASLDFELITWLQELGPLPLLRTVYTSLHMKSQTWPAQQSTSDHILNICRFDGEWRVRHWLVGRVLLPFIPKLSPRFQVNVLLLRGTKIRVHVQYSVTPFFYGGFHINYNPRTLYRSTWTLLKKSLFPIFLPVSLTTENWT